MEKNILVEQYKSYCTQTRNLLQTIKDEQDQTLEHMALQLKECFDLPITENSVRFFAHKIENMEQYLNAKRLSTEWNNQKATEGIGSGYTKVKKAGIAYLPVEDIEVPQFDMVPIDNPSIKGKEFPNYIFSNKKNMPIGTTSASNRGSSHVWMLALLTFLFETLFLVVSFFLYR